MPIDHLRYDLLAQDALRGLVRKVLTDTARKGLPGEHHFFISFDTRADGVRISPRLHEQYPEEMTIVLQHQFWDLKVADDYFEVGLSFGGVAERLLVPFTAIKSFVDPSVQFALQFEQITEKPAVSPPAKIKTARPHEKSGDKTPGKAQRAARNQQPRTVPSIPAPKAAGALPTSPADDKPDKPSRGGGEVVRLDRFRKK